MLVFQAAIFGYLLAKNNALDSQGKIDTKKEGFKKTSQKDKNRIKDIAQYLAYRNSINYLQPYFKEDLSKGRKKPWVEADRILALMGDEMAKESYETNKNETKNYYTTEKKWQKIEGYQYLIDFNMYDALPNRITLDKGTLSLILNRDECKLDVFFNNKELTTLNLQTTVQNLWEKDVNNPEPADMTVQTEGGKFKTSLTISQMTVQKNENAKKYTVNSLNGKLLLKVIE